MFGEHRVRCHHCGQHFTCGDCIKPTCYECEQTGHAGFGFDCPLCKLLDERHARSALLAEIEKLNGQVESLQLEVGRMEAENRQLKAMRRRYRRAL